MIRHTSKAVVCVLNILAVLSVAASLSGAFITFIGAPFWMPLPWSGFRDFVETADGRVFVNLGFYSRILCYDHDGNFIASLRYPSGFARDTGLAASQDGRIFFRTHNRLFVFDHDWNFISTVNRQPTTTGTWALDADGHAVFLAGKPEAPTLDRLAAPGDALFGSGQPRDGFQAEDGTRLVRVANHLERYSVEGKLLGKYEAPAVLQPFTFFWPGLLAWPYLAIYACLRCRKTEPRFQVRHAGARR